jgi:hypothetical protein
MRTLLACLLVGFAVAAGACTSDEQAAAHPASTTTVTVTETAPAAEDKSFGEQDSAPATRAEQTETFEGAYFSIDYPARWRVETAEASKGTYLDTTIRDPAVPEIMLRVDVTPGSFAEPAEVAAEVEAYLLDQPRYRRLRYESTTFLGYDAMRWDFVVEEGRLLRKSDIFFTTAEGDGVAVLIQAPADRYLALVTELEQARRSLVIGGEAALSEQYEPEPGASSGTDFCATHSCIDNFDNGTGYPVQCADGMWSQSGGRPGACSYHGGVAGGSGRSSGGSGYDDNGDGSSSNWCGASRDGDGDGLWCEGR